MTEDTRSDKLLLDGISKKYGDFTALKPTNLAIRDGEFLTLLGPSGSGKTTLLQMIAGLVEPTVGRMFFEGEDWTSRPVNLRGMGMVFQHYALFPHMTVAENIAFPLKMRGISQKEIGHQVSETLAKVQLEQFGHRFPRELSGGQQQRVALARCFVYRPKVILMDEPLGALDKSLRENMQLEIRRLHHEFGTTVIYVTHDQEEALVMSDRICVMNHAQVEQIASPREIYLNPETIFSASFIGQSNIVRGKRTSSDEDSVTIQTPVGQFSGRFSARDKDAQELALVIRPEQVCVGRSQSPAHEGLEGLLEDTVYIGSDMRLLVRLSDGSQFSVRHDPLSTDLPSVGDQIQLYWDRSVARIVS
ncbi:polyamine ABC transporter ATP-binding protein [Falsochrobactrum shanghaiense]|uniref:Spermidine/putrescine import ATP-binding protein PotA n=1 Tax=Falsochrobactrum shanghaiense TaxID=2201899 RepID=A0A316JAK7_9HYPH|nr:ABC transporter ATP-binding protein [Falsochrobactrum shanghaiense]PWL18386.1 polyamine ABC transporter ATP-binding protein [Falsochrobactrum shanghaiense]